MKNFDEFSKRLKINESEIKFLNEKSEDLEDLVDIIINDLSDNDIEAFAEENLDHSLDIEIGRDVYTIKKEGNGFVQKSKHNKPETFETSDALLMWWKTFITQHQHDHAMHIHEAKEPMGNIGLLHKDYADERITQWQKENKNTSIKVGDNVKIAFIDGDETEHMWVEITKVVDKDNFEGVLNNDPIVVQNIEIGDPVKVNRSQIEQLFEE